MFRRPNLVVTVFPILAFLGGVIVGKYLPLDFLPGPEPGEERLAPQADEVLSHLGREFGGLLSRRSGDSNDNGGDNGDTGAATSRPSEVEPPAQVSAAAARAFVEQPVLVVAVRQANTFVVQSAAGERQLLRLSGVPERDADLERELTRFIGFYLAVRLAETPVDDQRRLVGRAFVQQPGWQPGDPTDWSAERSLNDVIRRVLQNR